MKHIIDKSYNDINTSHVKIIHAIEVIEIDISKTYYKIMILLTDMKMKLLYSTEQMN